MSDGQKTGLANIQDAGAYLKISRSTIYKMLSEGHLPYQMVGCHKRIPWTALYEFSSSQNPERVLELKISNNGKAAIFEALDRMESEIAAIRKALQASYGRWGK